MCDAISRPDMKRDERYSTNFLRVKNRKTLIGTMSSILESKTCDRWLAIFDSKKCRFPYGPVNNIESVFNDPQVQTKKHSRNIVHLLHVTFKDHV